MVPTSPHTLACILLGSAIALARPDSGRSGPQSPFEAASSAGVTPAAGGDDRWTELARRYAPIIYLAETERFFPSSTSFILPALTVLNETNNRFTPQPNPLNQSNLDSLPYHGSDLHLGIVPTTDEAGRGRYNAQPDFPDDEDVDSRIYGQQPPKEGEGEWEVVALAVEMSRPGVVDLYYWTYYPFNLGKRVKGLGVVGNHISDWETVMVRTIDGEAVSVDYLAHTGNYGEGTVRWQDVSKEDGRPVAYSASGSFVTCSHGLWSTPGEHVYASALGLYKLVDSTSRGVRWDTSRQLITHAYFTPLDSSSPSRRRRRATFSGPSSWLNWRGIWGDFGQDDCWWHSLYPACQLVDGPQGPARDSLRETPRCVISGVSESDAGKSRYTFSVSPRLLPTERTTLVGVRQVCRRNGIRKTPDDDSHADRTPDDEDDEVSWTWQETPLQSLIETDTFEMDVPQCRRRLHVASYGIALAYSGNSTSGTDAVASITADARDRSDKGYVSELRQVCAYAEEEDGGRRVQARAVVVEDVDAFGWQE